jgi:hypothetical protein
VRDALLQFYGSSALQRNGNNHIKSYLRRFLLDEDSKVDSKMSHFPTIFLLASYHLAMNHRQRVVTGISSPGCIGHRAILTLPSNPTVVDEEQRDEKESKDATDGSHWHPDRGVISPTICMAQLAFFSNISHHCNRLLDERAGTSLRHQGL